MKPVVHLCNYEKRQNVEKKREKKNGVNVLPPPGPVSAPPGPTPAPAPNQKVETDTEY